MSLNIRSHLNSRVLLFDGAMGTLLTRRLQGNAPVPLLTRDASFQVEEACVTAPDEVLRIHREYVLAGANAIKTNTFALNPVNYPDPDQLKACIAAGYRLAKEAAEANCAVFADIGPVSSVSSAEVKAALTTVADLFLDLGAENFLFETQSDSVGLNEACKRIHEKNPEAFILVSFAVMPDGYSRDGLHIRALSNAVPDADAIGMNCVSSPTHMLPLMQLMPADGRPIAVMPNAGYPGVNDTRTFYPDQPVYFAEKTQEMVARGASIIGGCCGTTPDFIRAVNERSGSSTPVPFRRQDQGEKKTAPDTNRLLKKLSSGKKVILVELDPPKNADLGPFMQGAEELMRAGIDALTVADCPIARARADSSLLACKVMRELNLDVIPHMTCRDRNLNATKALILGLYGEGIRNILTVTGDPIPTAERDEVKSVYQFNSRKLARFLNSLSDNELPSPLTIFGALNINALRFEPQLALAKEKMEAGIRGFLTQPVLTEQGFENLKLAREALPDAFLMGGIIPVVSERNARFMDAEVRGINVDPVIMEMYHDLDRAQGEALGITISTEIARRIAPFVNGFYLMTPFNRTAMMSEIVRQIRSF